MSLPIVRYQDGNAIRWGKLMGAAPIGPDSTIEIAKFDLPALSTSDIIALFDDGGLSGGDPAAVRADQLLSPITPDATIFAQGLNYQSHAAEAQHGQRKSNLIFSKASSSLTGPFSDIVRPAEVELLDYEVEFGLVMRRNLSARDVVEAASLGDAVAGLVLCNDVSARDTMFGASFLQWFRGKSYRTFCPAGPALWLMSRDEVVDTLAKVEISLAVNGQERQRGSSDQLIWKPAETLTYIASTMDIRCGDLLLTGTPGGVTAPASPKMVEILQQHLLADSVRRDELRIEMTKTRPFLRPGDIVTATLSNAGSPMGGLANKVVQAA